MSSSGQCVSSADVSVVVDLSSPSFFVPLLALLLLLPFLLIILLLFYVPLLFLPFLNVLVDVPARFGDALLLVLTLQRAVRVSECILTCVVREKREERREREREPLAKTL